MANEVRLLARPCPEEGGRSEWDFRDTLHETEERSLAVGIKTKFAKRKTLPVGPSHGFDRMKPQ